MRIAGLSAALLVTPLVAAHGDIPGAPKIFGLGARDIGLLKSRNILGGHVAHVARPEQRLNARQGGADGRCGPNHGCAVCAEDYCCSPEGWCGQGADYCNAPDCLFEYGSGCDANLLPSGGSTRSIARPKLGNQPYGGEGIYHCTVPNTVAITYDDGPYIYTNELLDLFASYNAKATFFVTGNNIGKGAIDDASTPWPTVIKRMAAEGHQVASHTWSHQDLSAITKEQRYDQMVKNEMAFSNILSKFPTYMRPPYSSCTAASGCQKDLADLGYVVSYFDLDTDDYNNVTPEKIQNAKTNVAAAINPSNAASNDFLAIAHDIHQQTAQNLTGYMLDLMTMKGYRMVTMGECLGDSEANWYRAATGRVATSSVFTPPACGSTSLASASASASATSSGLTVTPTAVSLDSSCGPANGFTCLGFAQGECCSQSGYCGNSADHCGTGCQSGFGKCGISSSSSGSQSSAASSMVPRTSSTTSAAPSSVPSGVVSPDASCGAANGYICTGSPFGDCCSQYGFCGTSADHCGTSCNPLFGTCTSSSSPSSIAPVSSNTAVSSSSPSSSGVTSPTTTRSATSTGLTTSTSLVTTSTRPLITSTSTKTSSSAKPSATAAKKISWDGRCGGTSNQTCKGSIWGMCCSRSDRCGITLSACRTSSGCQSGFGTCLF